MTQFDELKARYPNLIPVQELRAAVSIIELAQYYGYLPQPRKGKSRPVLTHPLYQDTIIIKHPQDAAQQLYQRAGDFADAGTLIDFVRHRLTTVFAAFHRPDHSPFRCTTNVLYDYLRIDPHQRPTDHALTPTLNQTTQPPDEGFTIEAFDLQPLQEDSYLTRRLITQATLQRPEFLGKVVTQITYFDPLTKQTRPFNLVKDQLQFYRQFANVAFPYYNGHTAAVTGLELRNDTLKLHAPGSDRTSSVFVSNPPPSTQRFVVTESVIDALSHQQLRNGYGDGAFNTVYFATGGQVTPQQVHTIIRYLGELPKAPDWTLELAFDNDPKGHHYDLLFIQQLMALIFPLTPAPGTGSHYHYHLPRGKAFSAIRQAFIEWVMDWNQQGQEQATAARILIDSLSPGSQEPITMRLPATSVVLRAVSEALLTLTALEQHVRITKARGKDFNDDLLGMG